MFIKNLLLFSSLFCTACAQLPESYWFTSPLEYQTWRIALPSPPSRAVYQNFATAVLIDEVKCDGRIIEPEIGLRIGVPSRVEQSVGGGRIVYECPPSSLECWVDPMGNHPNGYDVRYFKMPKTFGLLTVVYRIRFPDGTVSKPISSNFLNSRDILLPTGQKK